MYTTNQISGQWQNCKVVKDIECDKYLFPNGRIGSEQVVKEV